MNFILKLLFKDGKYKFRFDNVIIKSNLFTTDPPRPYNGDGTKMFPYLASGKYNQGIIGKANRAFLSLSTELESAIKGTKTKKDDW